MVQVLPYVPSFGEKLAETLAQAGSNVAQGLSQRQAQRHLQSLFSPTPMVKLNQPFGENTTSWGAEQNNILPNASPYQNAMAQQPQQQAAYAPSPIENIINKPGGPTLADISAVHKVVEAASPGFGDKAVDYLLNQQKIAQKEALDIRKFARETEGKELDKLDELQLNILKSYETAQQSKANIDALEKLENTGNLITPLQNKLSEMFDVPIGLWNSPESEEFQKLVSQRALNVGQAYGFGRILQTEFENFLKTIPSLQNSPEGRKRILNTLRYFDNLAVKRYQLYEDILSKRHPGERASQTQAKLTKAMNPYYEEFSQLLGKTTPSSSKPSHEGKTVVIAPNGVEHLIPNDQVESAIKAGGKRK